jgi:hypothetical protein
MGMGHAPKILGKILRSYGDFPDLLMEDKTKVPICDLLQPPANTQVTQALTCSTTDHHYAS